MTHRIIASASLLVLASLVLPLSAFAATSTNGITVRTHSSDELPTCRVTATRTRIRSGETTLLRWKSDNADSMTGLGDGKLWAAKGHQRIAIGFPGTRLFTLWFQGPAGITSCNILIRISPKA